jgi:hypothetical protein
VALDCQVATLADDTEFAGFYCCDATNATPWTQEAENYVRAHALRRSQHCLAFRDSGALVAVSAFSPTVLGLPLNQPVDQPVWQLDVVAIALNHQSQGLSSEVFQGTFEVMRQLDLERDAVTAYVHQQHAHSIRACASAGLQPLMPVNGHYWLLLGPI